MSDMEGQDRKRQRLEIERRAPFSIMETSPRRHTRNSGMREVIVDKEEADGEASATVRAAVDRWIATGPVFNGNTTTYDGNVRRHQAHKRPVEITDLREVTLIAHECSGSRIGMLLDTPHVSIKVDDGRAYRVNLDGTPLAVCGLCKGAHERLNDRWKMPTGDVVPAHPTCAKATLRARQRASSQGLAQMGAV